MYHDVSYMDLLKTSLWLFAFFLVWDVISGDSRWLRKREEENKRELAEGWKRWEAGDWRIKDGH